ncbi:MAG TPA: MOSC N-terminal beta barrel domain-containing protein [Candidatus Limnocylindrales bacterium]|nr:MOSC N-terminal beta barrel domain-containing protein [Candidatus Limnocylindrales bacterium]
MSDTVPHVSALVIYPVKSCAGIALSQVHFGHTGPDLDRRWMVVAEDDGELLALTQRETPRLALAQPSLIGGELVLRAPGVGHLRVPIEDDRPATRTAMLRADNLQVMDEGLEAAEWFGELLDAEVRFVRLPNAVSRRVSSKYAPEPAYTSLTDGYPALLVSEESLFDLNERLVERGSNPVEMRRFRPNIVVRGVSAFAEDEWKHIRLGELPFDVVKPCARCAITTVDPALGEVVDAREPLTTLATYRRLSPKGKVMFAQNVIHRAHGVVHVGDALTVVE